MKKVDMKNPQFPAFGVIERNILTVKMIDMVSICEKENNDKINMA